jgi:hypothetical protein
LKEDHLRIIKLLYFKPESAQIWTV